MNRLPPPALRERWEEEAARRTMLRHQVRFSLLLVLLLSLTSLLGLSRAGAQPLQAAGPADLLAPARQGALAAWRQEPRPPAAGRSAALAAAGLVVQLGEAGHPVAAAEYLRAPGEGLPPAAALAAELGWRAAAAAGADPAGWDLAVLVVERLEPFPAADWPLSSQGVLLRRGPESFWVLPGEIPAGRPADLLEAACRRAGLAEGAWRRGAPGVRFLFFTGAVARQPGKN